MGEIPGDHSIKHSLGRGYLPCLKRTGHSHSPEYLAGYLQNQRSMLSCTVLTLFTSSFETLRATPSSSSLPGPRFLRNWKWSGEELWKQATPVRLYWRCYWGVGMPVALLFSSCSSLDFQTCSCLWHLKNTPRTDHLRHQCKRSAEK